MPQKMTNGLQMTANSVLAVFSVISISVYCYARHSRCLPVGNLLRSVMNTKLRLHTRPTDLCHMDSQEII